MLRMSLRHRIPERGVAHLYQCIAIIASTLLISDALADEDSVAIEGAYNDWLKVTNARDIDRWSRFLAPDPVFLPPASPALETREEIVEYYAKLFLDPNSELQCEMTFVQVSKARDMAWARGNCKIQFTSPTGEIDHGASKWTKVWVRDDDGTWKCRLNTWNHNGTDQ